jgi:Arc/MetJ family transcription regulator
MTVRTTLTLDDDLLAKAKALTGIEEESVMVHEALKALVERESMRHLAAGGSEPGAEAPPRRRTKPV